MKVEGYHYDHAVSEQNLRSSPCVVAEAKAEMRKAFHRSMFMRRKDIDVT
jgi:hypothetical protein